MHDFETMNMQNLATIYVSISCSTKRFIGLVPGGHPSDAAHAEVVGRRPLVPEREATPESIQTETKVITDLQLCKL